MGLQYFFFLGCKRPCGPLTVTLTVALAVDVTVTLLLHAEPLVDVPPVVVPAHRIKTTF